MQFLVNVSYLLFTESGKTRVLSAYDESVSLCHTSVMGISLPAEYESRLALAELLHCAIDMLVEPSLEEEVGLHPIEPSTSE